MTTILIHQNSHCNCHIYNCLTVYRPTHLNGNKGHRILLHGQIPRVDLVAGMCSIKALTSPLKWRGRESMISSLIPSIVINRRTTHSKLTNITRPTEIKHNCAYGIAHQNCQKGFLRIRSAASMLCINGCPQAIRITESQVERIFQETIQAFISLAMQIYARERGGSCSLESKQPSFVHPRTGEYTSLGKS